MGERIGASIQFGGELPRERVPELIALIKQEGLTVDFDENTQPNPDNLGETFGDYQVNFGNLDDLVAFACTNGLCYKYWHDSGPDWTENTTLELYDGIERSAMGSNGNYALTEAQINELGTIGAVHHHFAMLRRPLPPLEIIG